MRLFALFTTEVVKLLIYRYLETIKKCVVFLFPSYKEKV